MKAEPIASKNWKSQHNELVETMKYMREIKKREEKGLPINDLKAPPRQANDNLIPCPHCGRRFNDRFSFWLS